MKRLIILLAVVVAVALAALIFRDRLASLVVQREVTSGSAAVLEAVEQVGELETMAVVTRTVFPHEFYVEGLSYTALLRRVMRSGADAEEVLSPDELAHFQAANLAAELGLATVPGAGGFVVVTSVDRYGYRMDELSSLLAAAMADRAGESLPTEGPAVVTLPPALRLSFEIEDLNRDNYPFGNVPLDAQDWNEVSSFVREWVSRRHDAASYRQTAANLGLELIRSLLGGPNAPVELRAPGAPD